MFLPLTRSFYYSIIGDIKGPAEYFEKKLLFDYSDRELMTYEDNWYYTKLQRELDNTLYVDMVEFIVPICDSYDVGDKPGTGKYTYLCGAIDEDTPFIYAKPVDSKIIPFRLYLYGPEYQVTVSGDMRRILCDYETHTMRNALIKGDEEQILKLLRNTDRPIISF